jgi:hypothetical protein
MVLRYCMREIRRDRTERQSTLSFSDIVEVDARDCELATDRTFAEFDPV